LLSCPTALGNANVWPEVWLLVGWRNLPRLLAISSEVAGTWKQ